MIDRALGFASLAVSVIGLPFPLLFRKVDRKIDWSIAGCGVLLLIAASRVLLYTPDGEAQNPTVNQGPGSAYSYQQGGITAGTVNMAPQRVPFTKELADEFLTKLKDKNKPVALEAVGSPSDLENRR
jgi:hypothetical protein